MTDRPVTQSPAAAPTVRLGDIAIHQTSTPAPQPILMTKADILATTDHNALNRARMEKRVPEVLKDVYLDHHAKLLLAQPEGPMPMQPITVTKPTDLVNSSALPATESEVAMAAALEREAYTPPPQAPHRLHHPRGRPAQ